MVYIEANIGLFLGLIAVLSLSILLIYIFRIKQKLKDQKNENNRLLDKIYNLKQKQKRINRRKAFRLEVSNIDCELTLKEVGDTKLKPLINRKIQGTIHDISLSGAKLVCEVDVPVRNTLSLK